MENREYYGLEKHLESFVEWPNGKLLNCRWTVDKQKLIERLKAVPLRYPHLSIHDGSHSAKVVMNIEMFLGKERIKQLSASDTWMLLMCSYSHDIGMTMAAKDLQREFAADKNFYNKLRKKCMDNPRLLSALDALSPLFELYKARSNECDYWEEIIFEDSSATIAMEAMKQDTLIKEDFPMAVADELSAIIEAYARPEHPRHAKEIIDDETDTNTSDFIPLRLRRLVGEIAYLHGGETEDALKTLPYKVIGICGDYVHPRFCAYLLRIGDLLDMDNGRFNRHQMAVAGDNATSKLHEIKHDSIETFEINEREITVKANFRIAKQTKKDEKYNEITNTLREDRTNAYVLLKKWMNMLNNELCYVAHRWVDIVPKKIVGYCPQLKDVEYYIDSNPVQEDEVSLKYNISPQRAAELLEGSSIYKNPELAFIRELIQNSMDATKIQIYRDVLDGRFPKFIKDSDSKWRKKLKRLTPYCFLEKIGDNFDRYKVEVNVDFKHAKETNDIETIEITVRDFGIGITFADLKAMQNIGNIIKPDIENEVEQMPEWLKPTGSFGIGLQSIFYVARSFVIRSRPYGNDKQLGYRAMRKMTFYSSRLGGEINIQPCSEEEAINFGYGTEVKVEIPINTHYGRELYMRRVNSGEMKYDVFSNVKETFSNVIEEYKRDMFRTIGIPIYLLPNGKNKHTLGDMFGRFCLLLEENICTPLIDKSAEGFSVWSSKHNILIKYIEPSYKMEIPESQKRIGGSDFEGYEIFYKGIKVGLGKWLRPFLPNYLRLPFFKTQIFMYGDSAHTLLEINRGEFLYEKKGTIVKSIQNTHLCAMSFLARKLYPETPQETGDAFDIYKEIKELFSDDALGYLLLVSRFVNSGVDIRKLSETIDINKMTVPIAYYDNGGYRRLSSSNLDKNISEILTSDDIWFYNVFSIYSPQGGFYSNDSIKYLLPDYFFQYHYFAIKEAKILKKRTSTGENNDTYGAVDIAYKIGLRNGSPLKINREEYKELCDEIFKNAKKEGDGNTIRLVLPAIGDYPNIEVNDIPNRWRYGNISNLLDNNKGKKREEKINPIFKGIICKFDSWIISPLNMAELEKLCKDFNKLSDRNNQDELNKLIDPYLEGVNRLLFRYVKRKGCLNNSTAACTTGSTKDDATLKESYKEWLKVSLKAELFTFNIDS